MNSKFDSKKEINSLLCKKSNSFCADCFDSCALYVDITNRIFLCQQCASIHKKIGFVVKNAAVDIFTIEEIDKLRQSNNEIFNQMWMSSYDSKSAKIPFGASMIERSSFLSDKYINKKWFSSIPNTSNKNFYNPCHLEIQATEINDLDSLILLQSSSSSSFSSEYSTTIDINFPDFNQNEIIDMSPSLTAYPSNLDEESNISMKRRKCKKSNTAEHSDYKNELCFKYLKSSHRCSNISLRKCEIKNSNKHHKVSLDLQVKSEKREKEKKSKTKSALKLSISYPIAFEIIRHRKHSKVDKTKNIDKRKPKIAKNINDHLTQSNSSSIHIKTYNCSSSSIKNLDKK